MEYFKLLGAEPTIDQDKSRLKKQYFKLSKSVHPDFHSDASESEKLSIMEKSALLNKAYKTLIQEDACIQYVLDQKKMLSRESNESMPASFLMEMMELNEEIDQIDRKDESAVTNFRTFIDEKETEFKNEIHLLLTKDFNDFNANDWNQLKDYYLKKKYLNRLRQRLSGTEEI